MSPITTARTGTLVSFFILLSSISFAQFDNCATPTSLTPNSTCVNTSASLFNATSSGIAGSCAGTKYDVWFTFTTPAGCTSVDIDVVDIAAGGSSIDGTNTFLEAFSGATCSITAIGSCTPMGTTLTLTGLTPSTNYQLRVFTTTNPTSGNSGKWDFNICITYTPPPANDDCSGAVTLTSNTSCTTTAGSIVNTSPSTGLPAGCESAGVHNDAWYKFVAASTSQTVSLSGQGANFTNPEIQLYSGACGTLASLTCGSTTLTYTSLTIGATYYVRVSNIGTSPSTNGGFNICVTHPTPPPSNDDCSGAVTLTSALTCSNITGTLVSATASAGLPAGCESVGTHNDVWYKFLAANTTHAITISGQGSNFTNPEIQLYSGSCASLTSIGCGTTSVSSTSLTIGLTYYVRVSNVGSSPSSNGGFNICVTHPTPPPSNDDCSGAVTLTSATSCSNTAGTIVNTTASAGLPAGCETAGTYYDVWYKFTPSSTTEAVTLSGLGSNFTNARIQIYSGSCGALTSIACGYTSLSLTSLNIASTYYIRVSNVGSSPITNGGFNICVTHPGSTTNIAAGRMNEAYKQTTLSGSGALQYPWEVTYGPDNQLWITESRGYKVYRMDPNTGAKTTVLDISMGSTWLPSPLDTLDVQFNSNWPQGGLAGLAIHPQFLDGTGTHDFVYISYVHRNLGGTSPTGQFFRNKLVRFTYNSGTNKLESPAIVADALPGSNDHNSQRIIIAPVASGGTNYLFYASGDMGAGQFGNRDRPNNAQNPTSYEGKILRFNLESDGDAGAAAWIPDDNPYSATSPVYAIGIRNNQGFAYNPALNVLYGASHGPYSDDEINIIESFRNYGHPLIEGFADGNYNGNTASGTTTSVSAGAAYTDNLGQSSCPPIGDEVANKAAINALPYGQYKDPLFSAYPVPNGDLVTPGTVKYIWRFNPGNATPAPGWPTEAWSGLDIYTNKLIPGWKNSLVAASLKWGRLLRIKTDATGTATLPTNTYNDSISYFNSQNRFRDLAFSPDGKDIFVVMDNTSTTSGPGSANPVVPTCAGCVQKYTFLGYYDDGTGKSMIPTSIDVTDPTVNTCNTGTPVTIDNSNSNYWVPITGPDGNIMAEIYANGNNLGTVTSSFYKNSGSIRVANNLHYLDRNMTITPQFQPSSAVKIRLYISKAELDALIADPTSGVASISSLQIYKNNDPCSSAMTNAITLVAPTFAGAHGANGYVLQGNITSFSSFYFAVDNSTLPLNILTFTGQLQANNSVLLNWKTDNEINTSHFVLERSTDGSRFTAIGNVNASGSRNNPGPFNYSYTDNDAANQPSQRLYYRLKMVDLDGSAKYSNIVTIAMPLTTGKMTISPNPVISEVKVSLASVDNGKVQWKLMDNVGRTILKGTEQVNKGTNNFTINMNRLPAGTYYLNVTGAGNDQRVKMQKL